MALLINKHKGFSLIEAMLAVTVLLIMGVGSVASNRLATTSVTINQLRSQANLLATEGMEALLSIRADSFLSLSPGVYHPVNNGVTWTLASGSQTVGAFSRSIVLSPVMRDLMCFSAVCDIVSQGGIIDEGTLGAEVLVSWDQAGENKEIKLSSLITYWR